MVKIIIENLAEKEVIVGETHRSALAVFQEHHIDWLHTCGGKARCTSCKMIVTSGMDGLSGLTTVEKNYRRQRLLGENERLACQVRVTSTIRVAVPEETKLPHVTYSF